MKMGFQQAVEKRNVGKKPRGKFGVFSTLDGSVKVKSGCFHTNNGKKDPSRAFSHQEWSSLAKFQAQIGAEDE
jgi:hypothetical protein